MNADPGATLIDAGAETTLPDPAAAEAMRVKALAWAALKVEP